MKNDRKEDEKKIQEHININITAMKDSRIDVEMAIYCDDADYVLKLIEHSNSIMNNLRNLVLTCKAGNFPMTEEP